MEQLSGGARQGETAALLGSGFVAGDVQPRTHKRKSRLREVRRPSVVKGPIALEKPCPGAWPRDMASLGEVVRRREALSEQPHQESRREADDVEVITLDACDERRAETLNGVGAGSAVPLPARDVGLHGPL